MTRIRFVEAGGNETLVEAAPGDTLMQVAKAGGVEGVLAECGGSMACGTCHVYLSEEVYKRLGPPTEEEQEIINWSLEPHPTSRLSCQIAVLEFMDGATVTVPERQL